MRLLKHYLNRHVQSVIKACVELPTERAVGRGEYLMSYPPIVNYLLNRCGTTIEVTLINVGSCTFNQERLTSIDYDEQK